MREIKFRGKRVDNGECVFGYYVKYEHMGVIKHYIVTSWAQIYVNSHQVIPETVGQYTGLKDKNGTNEDIYEKDIMEFHAYGIHYIGVVEYHGSAFGIICRNTEVKASPFLDDAIDRHGAIKIGNIHDNPELIHDQKAIEPNVYSFCPKDDVAINAHKTAELMTKITIGVREGKFLKVILQEVSNDPTK